MNGRLFAAAIVLVAGCAIADPLAGPSPFELGLERVLNTEPATQPADPDVAWNGEDFFIVWSARYISGTDLFAIRVGPLGDAIDQGPWVVSNSPGTQHFPSIVWGTDQFLVVWEDGRDGEEETKIYGTWVTPRGEVIDPKGFLLANSRRAQTSPVAVWTGSVFLVVWSEQAGGSSGLDLFGRVVQPGVSTTATQGLPLVTAPGDQSEPALAWGQTTGLLVWSDLRSGAVDPGMTNLYAVGLGPDGRRLNPTDLLVSNATGARRHPAVVWDRSHFLLIWVDLREGKQLIYGARISDGGVVLDPTGVPITRGPAESGPPALVTAPPDQLVGLWTEIGQFQHLLVGHLWPVVEGASDGARGPGLIGGLAYVETDRAPRLKAATTGRGELLVVWQGRRTGSGNESQLFIRLARLPGE